MTPSSSPFNISSMIISEQIFKPDMAIHPGQSGFAIMPSGDTAFRVLNGMMRIAEKTLDAQYFSWESDNVGIMFINQLL